MEIKCKKLMKIINFYYLILFLLFENISSSLIRITATNEVKSYCNDGLYIIDMKVIFSSPFDQYYSFILNIENPKEIKFKCLLTFKNSTIHCIANLNSNQIKVERTEIIKLPRFFPIIKGFLWDYDSFVKNIYEKDLILEYNCKPKILINSLDTISNDEWGFIFNISSIYDSKCTYSNDVEENKYVFNMKLKLLDGFLKKDLINDDIDLLEYQLLEEIWIPLEITDNINGNFTKDNDFSFAFCNMKEKITNINRKKILNEGIDLECYIPVQQEQLMTGIIKIKPFFDNIYIKLNKDDIKDKNQILEVNLFFYINRTIEQVDNIKDNDTSISNEQKRLLRKNEDIPGKDTETIDINQNKNSTIENIEKDTNIVIDKELNQENSDTTNSIIKDSKIYTTIDYFLIGDQINKIYCPDKPIFTIEKSKNIQLKSSEQKNYSILLKGKLSFRHEEENNNPKKETQEEILFNLQVIDNLAENEDNQKSVMNCIIPNNTYFFNTTIIVYCNGNKISEESMEKNDTDITLNWAVDKNRVHEKIIIRWPKTKKKIKHIYSYTIKAFSLQQKSYGCFNNEFYFYIYIYSLQNEPDISFDIYMEEPKYFKANCKVHESSILKCYFPLYKDRLVKGTKISLPTNVTNEIIDNKGNRVLFIVDEYYYDFEDFHLTVKETCGNYAIVGALVKAGFNYFFIFLGIIGIGVFIFAVFICFICYIRYKINHKKRKGQYFAHIEEGDNSGIKK